MESYNPGNQGLRWLCGGCGEGVMFAVVDVYAAPHPAPQLTGRVEGWVHGGFVGGSSLTAARQAGSAIACVITTGSVKRCGGFGRSAVR